MKFNKKFMILFIKIKKSLVSYDTLRRKRDLFMK